MTAAKDRRLFAPFDIGMDEHPKLIGLSDAAFRALFEAVFYARRNLTDGFLDERIVLRRWGADVAAELSANDPERPSWVRVEGGWLIHDFGDHHPLRSEIEAKKADVAAKRSQAGRKGAASRWQADSKSMAKDSSGPEMKKEVTSGIADAIARPDVDHLHAPTADRSEAEKGQELTSDLELSRVWQADSKRVTKNGSETETETEIKETTSGIADAIARPDVDHLCTLLADLIEQNGSKRPTIGKGWRDSARLLLDKDGKTVAQVERAIRWCQASEFWRGVILSMPKLREKYDQLRLAAEREKATPAAAPVYRRPHTSVREQRDGFWFKDGTPMLGNGPGFMTREQRDEWMERTRAEAMRAR